MSTHLTDNEWKILEALWANGPMTLGPLLEALGTGWRSTTLHTYLTRMTAKGLVRADGESPRRYAAALGREDWTSQQRQELVDRLYAGSAGELVAAFVREGALTGEERAALRQLLDDMEV